MRRVYGRKASAQYPGRSVRLRTTLIPLGDGMKDRQKSAEGIVAHAYEERRPEHERAEGDRHLDGRKRRRQEG